MAKKELDLNNDGAIDVSCGGTGGTTAAAARAALGVPEIGYGAGKALSEPLHAAVDHSLIPGTGVQIPSIGTLIATSTTTQGITTGLMGFDVGEGKEFVAGMPITISLHNYYSSAHMKGIVEFVTGTSVFVNVTETAGEGVYSEWDIHFSGGGGGGASNTRDYKKVIDVTHPAYGAKGDGVIRYDAVVAAGSTDFSSLTAGFTSADTGKVILIRSAGVGGAKDHACTITYVSSTQVTLSSPAISAVSGAPFTYGTDDTDAIQAAMTAAVVSTQSNEVYAPTGVYMIAGGLQSGELNDGQLLVPSIAGNTSNQTSLTIRGDTPPPTVPRVPDVGADRWGAAHGTVFVSTLTSGNGSVIYGNPPPGFSFNNVKTVLRDITVRVPQDPTISGINLEDTNTCDLWNVTVDTGEYNIDAMGTQTTTVSYGIKLPKDANGAFTRLNNVAAIGFYKGFRWQEHATADYIAVWGCQIGLDVMEAGHGSHIGRVMFTHNVRNIVFSGTHHLSITHCGTEFAPGTTFATTYDVDDPNDYGNGYIYYHTCEANVGIVDNWRVNGGNNLTMARLNEVGKQVRRIWDAQSASNITYIFDSYGDPARVLYRRANGTPGSPTGVLATQTLAVFGSRAFHSGGAFTDQSSGLSISASQDHTNAARGTESRMTIVPNNTTQAQTIVYTTSDPVVGSVTYIGVFESYANPRSATLVSIGKIEARQGFVTPQGHVITTSAAGVLQVNGVDISAGSGFTYTYKGTGAATFTAAFDTHYSLLNADAGVGTVPDAVGGKRIIFNAALMSGTFALISADPDLPEEVLAGYVLDIICPIGLSGATAWVVDYYGPARPTDTVAPTQASILALLDDPSAAALILQAASDTDRKIIIKDASGDEVAALLATGQLVLGAGASPDTDTLTKLRVFHPGTSVIKMANTLGSSPTGGAFIQIGADDGTPVESGHRLGAYAFFASEDSNVGATHSTPNIATIEAYARENISPGTRGCALELRVTGLGGTTRRTVLAIEPDGEVKFNASTLAIGSSGVTPEGGRYTCYMAGEALVAGDIVCFPYNTGNADEVAKTPVGNDRATGVVYAGVAAGAIVKVVNGGRVAAYFDAVPIKGSIAIVDTAATGRLTSSNAPDASTTHWRECGHPTGGSVTRESRTLHFIDAHFN